MGASTGLLNSIKTGTLWAHWVSRDTRRDGLRGDTLWQWGKREKSRRRCAELALPGVCQDLGQGKDGEVCALQEDVLGSRAEFRVGRPERTCPKTKRFPNQQELG